MKENTNDSVSVLALLPLWRYAVGPDSNMCAAIPFYTLKKAREFFDETMNKQISCVLYKRVWFKGLDVIARYVPDYSKLIEKYDN